MILRRWVSQDRIPIPNHCFKQLSPCICTWHVDNLRGGSGNDKIEFVGGGGMVYGDSGADTFIPHYVYDDFTVVMDFNPAEGDVIDFSFLQNPWAIAYDYRNDGVLDTAIGVGNEIVSILFEYA